MRPMPSSTQSSASVSASDTLPQARLPSLVRQADDATFGRTVAVEGHGVRLDADGAAGVGIDPAARQRVDARAARSARRRAGATVRPAGATT